MRRVTSRRLRKLAIEMNPQLLIEVHNVLGGKTENIEDERDFYKAAKKVYKILRSKGEYKRIEKMMKGGI